MKAKPNMPQFDVFLSYSSVDKIWVMKLKDDLLRYRVSVWLDKDEIRPGDLFAEALERALDNCRAVALIVSPEAIASGWVKEEYYRALSLTKARQVNLQLIPVILRDAELPGFLAGRNWVDFRNETAYAQNVWKLVWGITGQKPDQVLPLISPDSNSTISVQPASQTETPTYVTFIHSGPVPPSYFIGRKPQIDHILSQLANPARGSNAVSGDPRVGKTSLLHYLCEPQTCETWGLSPSWCHFLYLDCHSMVPFSEAAFWRYTLRQLEPHLSDDEALSERVQWLLAQTSPDIFDLSSLFDEIARADRLVVLMLDEFEGAIENLDRHSPGMLYHLRALLNRPKRGLALLVATRAPLKQLCAGFRFAGSPFDNAFSAITLLPFSEAEVKELLDRYQVDLSPMERAFLLQMAGTHPYLVQLAAWLIVRAHAGQAEAEIPLAPIEAELEQETERYFSDMFRYSSQAEQMLLTWLALCPLSQHLSAVQTRLGSSTRAFGRYEQVLEHLVKRGLVLKQTEGPILFSPIFARWILRQVVIVGGRDVLSRWEPLYANFLSRAQKEALGDLADKVIRWPAVIKTPELLAQVSAQYDAGHMLLEKYGFLQLLGKGGWGDVYKALDLKLGREVAIKHLKADLTKDEIALKRFLLEAKIIAGLRHPNIITIHALERDGDDHYIVMEYAERGTLEDLLKANGPLAIDQSVDIAIAICRALELVHSKEIIHRDIKPSNILLFANVEGNLAPKLADFGTARAPFSEQAVQLTAAYSVLGTAAYMAPEQAQGEEVDARSDIYAIGVLLYETLTGQLPYTGNYFDILLAKSEREPTPPQELRKDVPDALNQLIMKALSKKPERRFQTAKEMAEALQSLKGEKTGKEQNEQATPHQLFNLLIILFFNLVVLAVLALPFGLKTTSSCVSTTGVGLSSALITVALAHLIWRYLGKTLLELENISIGSVQIPIRKLAGLFEQLHPRAFPNYILWMQAIIFFAVAVLLLYPVSSPFKNSESVPNVQNFLVHYTDGTDKTYVPGSLLQIPKGTMVLVEAQVSGQPGTSCDWFATKGTALPMGECAARYSPSVEGSRDVFTVLVHSPCRIYQTSESLHIEIVQDEP